MVIRVRSRNNWDTIRPQVPRIHAGKIVGSFTFIPSLDVASKWRMKEQDKQGDPLEAGYVAA